MRVVFMGTPDFAVPCLRRLLEDGHEVVGVFTQPDKPRGRGYTLCPPPVKELALEKGIPVWQPTKLRDGSALEILRQLAPELIVVVAYGRILPKDILDCPPLGCVNIHGSLLPKYRRSREEGYLPASAPAGCSWLPFFPVPRWPVSADSGPDG